MSAVTRDPERPASRAGETGWAELAEGRWLAARELFETAVQARESPEALEGLSWAAWWLDDAEAVLAARERAYRLYRERGDPESAARMASWLAADALDFQGAPAVAAGWLRRAHRLLDSLEPSPAHGWLAFFEGYLTAAENAEAAGELASSAAELGRSFGVPDLEMLGLALLGSTLVERGRTREGMQHLDEATAAALEGTAEIPISGAWACCFLVSTCISVRDFGRAAEWCDRIAEFAERYGSRYMLAFCRSEYGAVYLWRGRWGEAAELLEASAEDYARSRPALVAPVLVQQAELERRLGRPEEAQRLLDRAKAASAALGYARLALDRGDARTASELVDRYLRGLNPAGTLARATAHELAVQARIAAERIDDAAGSARELRALAHAAGTPALRAAADLADGLLAAARGAHDDARTWLEDAVDRYEQSGAPFEAAQARVELAECLLATGRRDPAEREARLAVEALRVLGADGVLPRAQAVLAACVRSGPDAPRVTPRERDVLRLLAEGLTNRQIAGRLVVSEHTVHRHVTNILRKLGLPSRAAAAAYAVQAGLVEARDP
jgi:LuxR family transcriptional regulator, maltose regulon positive regulatory protein